MCKKSMLGALLLFLSSSALAALPPAAESLRRLKAVAESKEVYDKLGAVEQIKSITVNGDDYTIQANHCVVTARVITVPRASNEPQLIGPLPLKVTIVESGCKIKP